MPFGISANVRFSKETVFLEGHDLVSLLVFCSGAKTTVVPE